MRLIIHTALVGLFTLAALPVGAGDDSYRVVTWSSLSDRQWSPLVQLAHEAEGKRWKHAESSRVVVHAGTREELTRLMEEAHYAWDAAGRQLALPELTNRVRLVCIYDASTWARLGREGGVRPDGLALQSGRDILVKSEPDTPLRADRVAHEMIHFRLREAYGNHLPLWLEEGMATRMGIGISRNFANQRGIRLTGEMPAIPAAALLSPAQLFDDAGYPESPASAQAFARQAAELVGELESRVGGSRWPEAIREIGAGGDWRKVLSSGYGVAMDDVQQLGAVAAQRAQQLWRF